MQLVTRPGVSGAQVRIFEVDGCLVSPLVGLGFGNSAASDCVEQPLALGNVSRETLTGSGQNLYLDYPVFHRSRFDAQLSARSS